MAANHLLNWICISCGKSFPPGEILYTCPDCSGNLDARYDYNKIRPLMTPKHWLKIGTLLYGVMRRFILTV